ncbi:MAG: hypothetical protein JSS66_17430 [Armatimonadetes bacterium]|nr:hypothetical protein [Armatimonadota bacterium]
MNPALLESTFGLFRFSRMVYAAAAVGVAAHMKDGPVEATELARLSGTHAPTLRSLLDALTAWGVFERNEQGQYGLTPFSHRLVPGSENAANLAMLLGWVGLPATYEAFGGLEHTLRTGEAAIGGSGGAGFYNYLREHPHDQGLYEAAMESSSSSFTDCVAAYDFSGIGLVVDVGGGQGAFALELLAKYPGLRAISYDLSEVVEGADNSSHPAHARLELCGGDAFRSVPSGGDLYVTSTVLRCFDDEACVRLLKSVRDAMPSHGKLVAYEMVMPETRDHAALCTADLLARAVYGGRDRTKAEFSDLFATAGLRLTRGISVRDPLQALEGEPV